MTARDPRITALLELVRDKPADAVVSVPAGWVHALAAIDANPSAVDLSVAQVAKLLGRDRCTVTSWCRLQLFPNAYKLRGRDWRIPPASLDAFQRNEAARSAA